MAIKSFFFNFRNWLQSTEMFEQPVKKVPGTWQLYEYYIDAGEELLHFNEDELIINKDKCKLEIGATGDFACTSTIPVKVIQGLQKGTWSVSKNYITFIVSGNFRDNVAFQFAFEKGNLKLLKKDAFGKIDFFGFFKRINK